MEQKIINNKYKVLDTLYSDKFQSIYICSKAIYEEGEKLLLNEFSDKDIIDVAKSSFSFSDDALSKKILDSFEIDEKYYALFPMASGTPLEEHLSKHNITLADKMLLTEELLKRFMEIDKSMPLIQYILCDLNNLSVTNRKYLSFNNLFYFNKDNLNIDFSTVVKRIGHIICCIFANTPNADINKNKDSLPPAILPIAAKAQAGSYGSASAIYEDFKRTLLYTTFIGSSSLDDQIKYKMKKAQKRYIVSWPRFVASIIIMIALLSGGFLLIKNILPVFGPGRENPDAIGKNNVAPVAEFSISISKIYSGDEVTFIDKSSDSDPGDIIKTRLWTVEKDDTVVLNSDEEILNYVFDQPGDYKISLVVQDSKGARSEPSTHKLKVLEKPDLPSDAVGDDGTNQDMK
ncbi:MAG: PKD domain-containing protein [Lutispora sp.]|nr:PKD domain-containing protein [Lutispora sp.]